MKNLILYLVFSCSFWNISELYGQNWKWGRTSKSWRDVEGYAVAADPFGYVYGGGFAMSSTDTVKFDSVVLLPTMRPGYPIFWNKYNSAGRCLWAGQTVYGYNWLTDIAADNEGNLIVFGSFIDSIKIGSYVLTNYTGGRPYFIAKISPHGTILWAVKGGANLGSQIGFRLGGTDIYSLGAGGVTTDSIGNIYVTSSFKERTMTVPPFTLINSDASGASSDIYVAKYNPSGALIWARSFGGSGFDHSIDIVESTGNIYITGSFTSPVITFGPSALLNPNDTPNVYIAKLSSATGGALWAEEGGGIYGAVAMGLAKDVRGSIFITGSFSDTTISFGSTTITRTYPGAVPKPALFLVEYSRADTSVWGKSIGSPTLPVCGYSSAVSGNKIFVSGAYDEPVSIDGSILPISMGYDRSFVASYAISGGYASGWGLTSGGDDPNCLSADGAGNVYMVGDHTQTSLNPIVFSTDSLKTNFEAFYISKLSDSFSCGALVAIAAFPSDTVCPGTAVTFNASVTTSSVVLGYQWYVNGVLVSSAGPAYSYVPLSGDSVRCVVTSAGRRCPTAVSASNTIVINNGTFISISSTAGDTVCAGTPVTFNAVISTIFGSVSYQWYVNGALTSSAGSSYTYVPVNGDSIRCTAIVSGGACSGTATEVSNVINMVVNPVFVPAISITISPGDTVCPDSTVMFMATTTGGGSMPHFQWIVNGSYAGIGDSTYAYTPANGDIVSCLFTSSELCAIPATVYSDTVIVSVRFKNRYSIGDTAVCVSGDMHVITLSAPPGITYLWYDGDTTVSNTVNVDGYYWVKYKNACVVSIDTFHVSFVQRPADIDGAVNVCLGDTIHLSDSVSGGLWLSSDPIIAIVDSASGIVAGNNVGAVVVTYTLSNGCFVTQSITVVDTPCVTKIVSAGKLQILSIYPNPANEELHIEHTTPNTAYTLYNLVGEAVQQGTLPHTRNTIPLRSLPSGMYLLHLTDEQGRRVVKKVVKE